MANSKRRMRDPEMDWNQAQQVKWCEVCKIMHPAYFICRRQKEIKK